MGKNMGKHSTFCEVLLYFSKVYEKQPFWNVLVQKEKHLVNLLIFLPQVKKSFWQSLRIAQNNT